MRGLLADSVDGPNPVRLSWIPGTLAIWLLLLSACGSSFKPVEPKSSDPELLDLRRQNVELQKRATVSEMEVARLRQEVSRLRQEMADRESFRRSSRGAGTVISDEDPVRPEAQIAGQGIEESDLELEEAPVVDPYATSGEAIAAPMAAPDPGDPQALYDSAYTLFHQRRYSEAELQFQRFLDLYPQTELSDNALFWIGESRYAMGDYPGALEAFTRTVQTYPSGNKISDALLKAGKCFEAMQDLDRARETYRELERLFADSSAAAAARERLIRLGA